MNGRRYWRWRGNDHRFERTIRFSAIRLASLCRGEYIQFMPYSPLTLANTFIVRYGKDNPLGHMKLQKLTYYAYGWWLAYNHEPMLDEAPQVWKHGPVFESLYFALRPYGDRAVIAPVAPPNAAAPVVPEIDQLNMQWVDWVWNRYGQNSGFELSDMTHEKGTPWQTEAETWNYRVPKRHRIPDPVIKEYFERLAANLS